MPTPFMHLKAANRFLNDPAVPESIRRELGSDANLGAFLLGNVAPDARVSGGLTRGSTHFFEYKAKVDPHACVAMLTEHPDLKNVQGSHRAFIAGYLAHLTMDVVWCEDMLFANFYERPWADMDTQYMMLHVLLAYLDARDYRQWANHFHGALQQATPQNWLTFLSDADLGVWRDIVARQICDNCESETINVLGKRVRSGAEGLRSILNEPERLQIELWTHIPQTLVSQLDEMMYEAMVGWIIRYMENKG